MVQHAKHVKHSAKRPCTIIKRQSNLPEEDRYTSEGVGEHRTVYDAGDLVFDTAHLSDQAISDILDLNYVDSVRLAPLAKIPEFPVPPVPVPVEASASRELLKGPDSLNYLNIPALHDRGLYGQGQTVAVLDTGMDATWAAYLNRTGLLAGSRSFVGGNPVAAQHFHGSHVGGIVHRVAPKARHLVGQVLGPNGEGGFDSVMAGVEWAVASGAGIVNLSLGGPFSDHFNRFIDRIASDTGVLFVVAAGNDYCGAQAESRGFGKHPANTTSPASAKRPLCVGNTDWRTGQIADSSSCGRAVDVAAPGYQINSWGLGGKYMLASGTSMATPFVSGVAALISTPATARSKARRPALVSTARDTGLAAIREGAGVIDASAAYEAMRKATRTKTPVGNPKPDGDDTSRWYRDTVRRMICDGRGG